MLPGSGNTDRLLGMLSYIRVCRKTKSWLEHINEEINWAIFKVRLMGTYTQLLWSTDNVQVQHVETITPSLWKLFLCVTSVVFRIQNALKPLADRFPPRTPLGILRHSPKPPNRLEGGFGSHALSWNRNPGRFQRHHLSMIWYGAPCPRRAYHPSKNHMAF